MIASLGFILLVIALLVSIFAIVAYLLGIRQKNASLMYSGRTGVLTSFILVTISFAVLTIALLTHHFEISYVAQHTSLSLPTPYLVSALWAGNEGSLFFWCWVVAFCSALVVLQARKGERELVNYAAVILSALTGFFLVLLVFVVNPFKTQSIVPADGAGLNPLLQNPAMIIHPPLLLAGYAIFAVPFAFGISALITRRLDDLWVGKARSWAILGWLALGMGNLIGAWWAYVELGWGGYWAWDPVENAGLMPWLVATAFLHSVIMQRRRGMFKVLTMFLVILTFWLTIFGTFLTRSNLLNSVHTFGVTGIEPYFIALLVVIIICGIWLLSNRSKQLSGKNQIESMISRDGSFLLNNLLLVVSAGIIFLGTMFPAFARWFGQPDVTVDKSFFNMFNTPIFIVSVLLTGICIVIGWKKFNLKDFYRRAFIPLIASAVIVVLMFLVGFKTWYALIAYFFCFFAILSTLWQWVGDLSWRKIVTEEEKAPEIKGTKFWASKNRYGAYIVHVAIALISVGIIGSSLFDKDQTATLKPGESTTISKYKLTYNTLDVTSPSANNTVIIANISVMKNGVSIGKLHPQQTYYSGQDQTVSEVAIRTNLSDDLYVILSGWDNTTQEVNLHVLVNPLVMWLWIGSGVLLLGGLVCFWPQPLETMNLPAALKPKPENRAKKLPEPVQKQKSKKTKYLSGRRK